jgi:hypothetical protein
MMVLMERIILGSDGMVRPALDFKHKIASVGLGIDDLAQQANVSRSAIFSWLDLKRQPSRRGIRLKKAWAIARVYAQLADIDKKDAFSDLFIEVEDVGSATE